MAESYGWRGLIAAPYRASCMRSTRRERELHDGGGGLARRRTAVLRTSDIHLSSNDDSSMIARLVCRSPP